MALGVPDFDQGASLSAIEKQKVKSQSYAPQMLGVRPVRAPALRLPIERPELVHSKLRYTPIHEKGAKPPKQFHIPAPKATPHVHAPKIGRYHQIGK